MDGWWLVPPFFNTMNAWSFHLVEEKTSQRKIGKISNITMLLDCFPSQCYYWEVLLEICFSVITFYWSDVRHSLYYPLSSVRTIRFGHMSRKINFQNTKICQLPFSPPHKLIIVIQLHPVFWWRCLLFYEKTDNFHCYQWHERKLTMALKWNLRPSVRRHDAAAGC